MTNMKKNKRIWKRMGRELAAGYDYEVRTAEAYARYKEWCYKNGHGIAESSQKWKQKMERVATIKEKRPKAGGSNTNMLLGYRLRPLITPLF